MSISGWDGGLTAEAVTWIGGQMGMYTSFFGVVLVSLSFATLTGCGGGDAVGGGAVVAPEVQLARELQGVEIDKNPDLSPYVTPFVNESLVLYQQDQRLLQSAGNSITGNRYVNTLNRLVGRGKIGRVHAFVSSDLACTEIRFGGGVAGDSLMILDGRLLDLMADIANGLALYEAGRTSLSTAEIVDLAASQQLSFPRFCSPSDPVAFPDITLSSLELERSVEIFTQFMGGVFFHEFGHIWNWHRLRILRESLVVPGGGFFSYTSAIEDNADMVSGILNAKSGHDAVWTKMAYDLLTFAFFYRQSPGYFSFMDTYSWQAQYTQSAATYSSLTNRKALVDLGYSGWQRR